MNKTTLITIILLALFPLTLSAQEIPVVKAKFCANCGTPRE